MFNNHGVEYRIQFAKFGKNAEQDFAYQKQQFRNCGKCNGYIFNARQISGEPVGRFVIDLHQEQFDVFMTVEAKPGYYDIAANGKVYNHHNAVVVEAQQFDEELLDKVFEEVYKELGK